MSEVVGKPPDGIDPLPDPRVAILRAAQHDLNYAKQYLDKFDNWPDYVLATYYHACVSALSPNKQDWNIAKAEFAEVKLWLEAGASISDEEWDALDGKQRAVISARRRIRAEAMFNRAVLLGMDEGTRSEAVWDFEELIEYIDSSFNGSLKSATSGLGIRIAAEVALLDLESRLREPANRRRNAVGRWNSKNLFGQLNSTIDRLARGLLGDEAQALNFRSKIAEREQVTIPRSWFADLGRRRHGQTSVTVGGDEVDPANELSKLEKRIAKTQKDIALLRYFKGQVSRVSGGNTS